MEILLLVVESVCSESVALDTQILQAVDSSLRDIILVFLSIGVSLLMFRG